MLTYSIKMMLWKIVIHSQVCMHIATCTIGDLSFREGPGGLALPLVSWMEKPVWGYHTAWGCAGLGPSPRAAPCPSMYWRQYLHSAATPGTQVLLHFSNCTPPFFFFFSLNDCAERLFSLKLYFFCSHSVKWIPLCLFYASLHSSRD